MSAMHNTDKKKAIILGAVALVILMFLFYFLTIFQNLKGDLDSAKMQVEQKQGELNSLQNEAAQAKVRESEYNSLKNEMGEMVTVFYSPKEEEERILYEIGEIFAEAEINIINLSFTDSLLRMREDNISEIMPTEEESSESETTTAATTADDTIKTEKMVTMQTTVPTTKATVPIEFSGSSYDVTINFKAGYDYIKNLVNLIQDRTKHIIITNLHISNGLNAVPVGEEIIEYEVDEAGVPNDYDKLLKVLEESLSGSDTDKKDYEKIMVFDVNLSLQYIRPEFVDTYMETQPFEIPEDLTYESRAEDPDDFNPFMPVPWYDDDNEDALESRKKADK